MDRLPFVTTVYARDLVPEDYFIGYLLHPYMSLILRRGCKSRMQFLPVAADNWRSRLPDAQRLAERRRRDRVLAKRLMPQIKEFFFDDDTFTDDRSRARGGRPTAR